MSPAADRRPGSGPETIAELLDRFPAITPPTSTAGAAVTIVLRDGASEVETLLIERTERPTDPASGQVAFPGGRVEDSDGSLLATALRELEEEVGLTRADLGGPPRFVRAEHALRFGIRVGVFAAALGPTGGAPTAVSSEEVAHVFWLPRSGLDETRRVLRQTSRGFLEVPATVFEGHVLWGFTRRVVREFFGLRSDDEWGGPVFAPDPSRLRTTGSESSPPTG